MAAAHDSRRRYQQRVQELLDEIERRRRHQLRLAAHGVTAAGLKELSRELEHVRTELAALVAAGSRTRDDRLAAAA